MTYIFTFDASSCSGCKACQVACKDKNSLPVGVLWRRVYEVSGGSWTNVSNSPAERGVWESSVFAYNLSLSCNHCVHPKCAGVCPTDAYVVRPDGIVYIDENKCMGCGYCAWACPYSAPQFNPEIDRMSKCDFCYDRIDAGLPPACVAACPMRVLDFATVEELTPHPTNGMNLWELPGADHPFPMPTFSRTEPHLLLRKHASMDNHLEKMISNREEIHPPLDHFRHLLGELPLVMFTLSAQAAAGMALFSFFSGLSNTLTLAAIGILLAIGGLSSFFHLGIPWNAWRSLGHLRKSWLSREILMFFLFSLGWLLSWVTPVFGRYFLPLAGLGLVYSMAQVYRLRSVPSWNTQRTLQKFFLSAILLGGLLFILVSSMTGLVQEQGLLFVSLFVLLGVIFRIILASADRVSLTLRTVGHWVGYPLALAGLLLGISLGLMNAYLFLLVFIMVLIAEYFDRLKFFKSRAPTL